MLPLELSTHCGDNYQFLCCNITLQASACMYIIRKMFPVIKVRIEGLIPTAMYNVRLEFEQQENFKWKFLNGVWMHGSTSESPDHSVSKFDLYPMRDSIFIDKRNILMW